MKWRRWKSHSGTYYYSAEISDTIMLHVWLEKSRWQWIVAGWPTPKEPAIFRHGSARTLKEATRQVEALLPQNEEQLVWINL